jgi:uncharacterized tellurite resistance protein B-like protein
MNFSEVINLFRQGKGTAKSHMKNLIEMAAADGHFHHAEFDLLKKIAARNNISEHQLKLIQENPTGIKLEIPQDKREKFHQLYDLVHMMSVDHDIHPEEQKLCSLFAIRFGYERKNVDEILNTIRENIKNGLGHDEAMKRVALILN